MFWHAWGRAGFTVDADAARRRPCTFINPAILPHFTHLGEVADAARQDPAWARVCLVALRTAIDKDTDPALALVHDPVARAILVARLADLKAQATF